MNSRQLQYAIALSEIRHFSQVAEKLNISQPALSKQILNLENELGVRLFDRTTTPVTVTPAGQHFIREAQELLYKEDQLLRSMEQYKTGEAGQMVIGVTPFYSFYMLPEVVRPFREAYPHIQIKLQEEPSDVLRKEAAEGRYDFAVLNLPVDETALDVVPLEPDEVVLVIPSELEKMAAGDEKNGFGAYRALPFATVQKSQEMRRLFDQLCMSHGFTPNIVAEVVSMTTAWAMACAGAAATILPRQFVNHRMQEQRLKVVEIPNTVYTRQPVLVTKKGQYIAAHTRYAMELLSGAAKK